MLEVTNKTRIQFSSADAGVLLRRAFPRRSVEVSLAFVGDAEMRRLNRQYRQRDKTTDVLSFLLEPGLGQIIISAPQARRDAREARTPLREKLLRLIAHGLLHLRGYDHTKPHERKRMERLEERILKGLIHGTNNHSRT